MADRNPDPGVTPLGKERVGTPPTPPDKGGPEWEGKTERKDLRPEVAPGRRETPDTPDTPRTPDTGGGGTGASRPDQGTTGGDVGKR